MGGILKIEGYMHDDTDLQEVPDSPIPYMVQVGLIWGGEPKQEVVVDCLAIRQRRRGQMPRIIILIIVDVSPLKDASPSIHASQNGKSIVQEIKFSV